MGEAKRAVLPALILAAGYGRRLAPVTDHVPKPLLPVHGTTLLDRAIAAVAAAGADPVVVNAHHRGDLIAAHLAARADAGRFRVSHEPEILGTGGALDGARAHLAGHPCFLLHNADILCDADLGALVADHARSGAAATLLLAGWPAVNSVTLAGDGSVTAIGPDDRPAPGSRRLTYTGIAVIGAEILADVPSGFSSLIDPLVRALAGRRGAVRGFAPANLRWRDLGTLGRWLTHLGDPDEQPLGAGSVRRITGHGSDRRFWRLAVEEWSAVAMLAGPRDEEFVRGAEIISYLHERGLGGAKVLARDDAEGALLLEDLGDNSLRTRVQADPAGAEDLYRRVAGVLLALQGATGDARASCTVAVDRRLDEAALRGETDYFKERFLAGHMGLDPADHPGLDEEFAALARAVAAQPAVLLHRDFQSENILVDGERIGLVDVQGMRLGPVGYDVMSLAYDPYVDLAPDARAVVVEAWLDGAIGLSEVAGRSRDELRPMALAAGLQRLMQALGAFGFLGRVKKRPGFLAHVPRALANLRQVLDRAEDTVTVAPARRGLLPVPMPALRGVLDRCGDGSDHRPLDESGGAG